MRAQVGQRGPRRGEHDRRLGARVEHAEALGLRRRQRLVSPGDGVEEGVVLALQPVGRLAAAHLARRARGRVGAQQQRALGAQATGAEVVDLVDRLDPQPPADALVGQR